MECVEKEITTRKGTELKDELRQVARDRLSELSAETIAEASREIEARLWALPVIAGARAVGCFLSRPRETRTAGFIARCREAGKKVCVPAFKLEDNGYGWAWLEEGKPLRQGRWGIEEPAAPVWAHASELDLIVVPGLAFDPQGHRLGHGAGYLDRLLAGSSAYKVGVAFERQLLEAVPAERHDVAVDIVITEKRNYPSRTEA